MSCSTNVVISTLPQKTFPVNLTNSENFKQTTTINEDVVGKIIVENQKLAFPNAPKIHVSFNYDHFVPHPNQRPIEKKNLQRIRSSVEQHNLLPQKPIDVIKTNEHVDENNPLQILDGNHRYQICREKGFPIYFIIHDEITPDDIQRLNYNVSRWSIIAFMHHFISRGNQEYAKFKKFYEDFDLSAQVALPLTKRAKNRKGNTETFRSGKFVFSDEDSIRDWISLTLEFLNKCYQYGVAKKQTFERKEFFDAYDKLMNHPKFSQKKALENIEKRGLHLATYATSGDYYRALLHFINVKE